MTGRHNVLFLSLNENNANRLMTQTEIDKIGAHNANLTQGWYRSVK